MLNGIDTYTEVQGKTLEEIKKITEELMIMGMVPIIAPYSNGNVWTVVMCVYNKRNNIN